MPGWNFADLWEAVAATLPDAPALVQGDRRFTWSEFDARANGLASTLLDAGAVEQDKVAHYLYNCPEYLESTFAIFKAGLVPVNTNYRYAEDELVYLWDNADAVAVIFHGTFSDRIDGIRSRVPNVKTWLWVDDGSGPCPDWATSYENAVKGGVAGAPVAGPWGRDGDHIYMLYTGGTTGMPKGVMWRQDDIFGVLNAAAPLQHSETPDYDASAAAVAAQGPGIVGLPACPLMHGTGAFTALTVLNVGGCVVTLPARSFDEAELLDAIEREGVSYMAVVGDAFAKPVLRALEANPDKWDITPLKVVVSSGVMFSTESKQALLAIHPGMIIADAFSSSEALGMGSSLSSAAGTSETAKFMLGENARVITDDGRDVVPGSGEVGIVAVKGRVPLGYYKDEAKSAATFKVIDGARYSVPGDYATVEADGSLKLLGRGSVCINTGGEKVYPEEVEEVLKTHPAVRDAVAVGVPDDRFGEIIVAMVEPGPEGIADEADIINHVKAKLSSFKAPKRVLTVDTIGRAPNGKVDYKRLKQEATDRILT